MKAKIRRALSLLTALAIICSLAVLPASAAGTLVLEIRGDLSDDGKSYTADLYVTGAEKANAYNATLTYDADVLEVVEAPENIGNGFITSVNSAKGGEVQFGGMSVENVTPSGGELLIGKVTLRIKADVEGQPSTSVAAEVTTFTDVEQTAYNLPSDRESITVQGVAPAIATLTLSQDEVEVNGGSSTNVTVTAAKADGTTVSLGSGDLKVSPADQGVSVSGGALVVDGKAKAGTYTVSVDNGNPASNGTATLTVTRATSVITSVEIDGDSTIALSDEGGNVYSATVKDQYGDEVTTTVTWTLTGADADVAALSSTTGKSVAVTLKDAAEEGDTFTLTAEADGKSDSVNIRVVQGIVNAVAERWTGDDGSRIYIAIEDIDQANSIRDLYLEDLLPSRVRVTYPNGEDDYRSEYRVTWSGTRLWNLFKDLRDNWAKNTNNSGRYVVSNLGYYIESDGTEDTPVVIDYSNWFTLIIDEGSADASGWYEEESTYVPPVPSANFTDVADGYWAAEDINWCYAKNVMLGNSATTFNPTGVTSRQQLWMVLARVNGSAPDSMATARTWAINMGVSDGTNVSGSLTRQQMVAMLYRYSAIKGYSGKIGGSLSDFSDAGSVSSYATDAMSWAVANGIITGNDGRLDPNGTATRAQFAAIMHRFCDTFQVI